MARDSPYLNICDFGAKGNENTPSTSAIQSAIDTAAASKGGVIWIPTGVYLCGTIHLCDNLLIRFAPNAILRFNPDEDDFDEGEELGYDPHADSETSYFHFSMLLGDDVENLTIEGPGELLNTTYKRGGPKPIALKNCQRITIRDITISSAPNYCISLMDCDNVCIENVKIQNAIADGIDIDNSRFVRISNCHVDSFDDAICLKTSPALNRISETTNITITNCILASSCNAFKFGTESNGDFKYITFNNSIIYPRGFTRNAISGIALESVDGAHIQGVTISNIVIYGANCPIFLRLGWRGRANNPPHPGSLEQVIISNIIALNASFPCIIAGIPNFPIRHISINTVQIEFGMEKYSPRERSNGEWIPREGTFSDDSQSPFHVPEQIDHYPEAEMFGELPAWACYFRHAEDIHLSNMDLHQGSPNKNPPSKYRPPAVAIVCEDSTNLYLEKLHIIPREPVQHGFSSPACIWGYNIQEIQILRVDVNPSILPFIRLSGTLTRKIIVDKPKGASQGGWLVRDPEVPPDEDS